ncbi:MAG: glycosyltransferase [Desulfobacterales bacterium]|nr:glycosyltransferase [Desulfobacterales bacterium]
MRLLLAGLGRRRRRRAPSAARPRTWTTSSLPGRAAPGRAGRAVLQAADVFVLPSFFEGLPLVVVESLACGCRVVMTDLPGVDAWMPAGLCAEGLVERVPLPRLVGADTPGAGGPAGVRRPSDRGHRAPAGEPRSPAAGRPRRTTGCGRCRGPGCSNGSKTPTGS